jgi:hypothetical protein
VAGVWEDVVVCEGVDHGAWGADCGGLVNCFQNTEMD